MAQRKKKKKKFPRKPPDSHNYILVRTRERDHYRKKRGTVKLAELNATFKKNVTLTTVTSRAAKAIRSKLQPFLKKMDTGRFIANVSGLLKKEYNKNDKLDLKVLKDYDLQPYFPIGEILKMPWQVENKKDEIVIKIQIGEDTMHPLNNLISDYFFEIILLYGDPGKANGLRIDSDISPVYFIDRKSIQQYEKKNTVCTLGMVLPTHKTSWVIFLKIGCHEGKEIAHHPRHYGMKVVSVGGR